MRNPTISDAIFALGIDGGWKIKKGKIDKWYSEKEQPSDDAIQEKLKELQKDFDSNAYARTRQQNYPSKDDLIVALWEKVMEGRGESADALEVKRQEVKTAHPKPE